MILCARVVACTPYNDHWRANVLICGKWVCLFLRTPWVCMKISFPCKRFLFYSLNVGESFFYRQCVVLFFDGREGDKYAQVILFLKNYSAPLKTQTAHLRWGGHPCLHGWRVDSRMTSGNALYPDPFEQFFDSRWIFTEPRSVGVNIQRQPPTLRWIVVLVYTKTAR